MKTAAVFTAALSKLGRMVALQSWPGATVAGRAMEKMEELLLTEPYMLLMVYVGEEEYADISKGKKGHVRRSYHR